MTRELVFRYIIHPSFDLCIVWQHCSFKECASWTTIPSPEELLGLDKGPCLRAIFV